MDLQPEIYLHLSLSVGAACLFYLLIPGAGAFYVRSSWRRFRRSLLRAVGFPTLDYKRVHGEQEGYLGCFRFFGRLQAFSGDEMVWLSDGKISVRAQLDRVRIYILPQLPSASLRQGRYRFPDESPRRVEWNRIGPLPEYTKFFIAGGFYKSQTGGYFDGAAECPLTVLIYDSEERDLFPQAIWTGRQRNEYWNLFTPWALAAGSLLLFIQFYLLFRLPELHLSAVTAVTLALLPILAFAPPGLLFYYLYRSLWGRGRELRAIRDLLRIPTSVCVAGEALEEGRSGCRLPDGETYRMLHFPHPPDPDELGTTLWRIDVPYLSSGDEGWYVFATEPQGSAPLKPPRDPVAQAVLIPGNPYRLSERCEKHALRSEVIAVALFLLGTVLNGLILFTALMYLLR